MSENSAQRGRPKGTGLDDHARLKEIAALIARDPAMKPTTAIKSTGVTDPSAIRRLRDKYHASRGDLAKELKTPAAPQPRTAALKMPEPRKSAAFEAPPQPESAARAEPDPEVSLRSPPAMPSDLLALWCGLGFQGVTNALELQKSLFDSLLRMPPMATALRGQLALNEMAVAWCPGTRLVK